LTLAAAVSGALTYAYKSAVLLAISKIAIFALLLNALGHCILSLKRRELLPGTLSAVALVLPYSAVAIVIMRASLGDSFWSLFRDAMLGLILAPLAILSLLGISYGLSRLTADPQKP
jgi:hypothetical protein